MNRSPAAAISDAVLYEGYLLYPYRESAIKNQYRWTFGCLFPEAWCRQYEPSDRDRLHAEFLLDVTPRAELDIRLRCLVLPSADRDNGEAQPVERQVIVTGIRPAECIGGQRAESFAVSAETNSETDGGADRTGVIRGELTIGCIEVEPNVFRVSIEVRNVTESYNLAEGTRDRAARQALLSTQLSLRCRNAGFISLIDPPAELQTVVSECRNDGCWPVLAGLPGTHDQMLIAPIILYDYPQVAPESLGELFDGTEIDEMLTMRIRTLTDGEKAEMAHTNQRTHDLLRRSEQMPDDELSRMHGVMRSTSTVTLTAPEDVAPESLHVEGVELRPGDQVRLRPKGRNDIFDLALAGRIATIETIERDFGDQLYFTVTADCDPGRDFGRMGLPGHRFYFRPDEVEPLLLRKSEEP